jgi:hypothetical protein
VWGELLLDKLQASVEITGAVDAFASKTKFGARRDDPRVEQRVTLPQVGERALALLDTRKTALLPGAPAPRRDDVPPLRCWNEKDGLPHRAEHGRDAPRKRSRALRDDSACIRLGEQILEDKGEPLLPHRDRPFEEIDGTRNGPSLIHRQARERGTGGAGPQAVLTYLMPVKVIDLQIPFAGEQTRQRRLSRLRTASDPQHVREPLTRIVHEPRMMRRNVYEKQSSANAVGGAQ